MAEEENTGVLSSLFEALTAYQDTQDALARVKSTAQSVFGEDWRKKLPNIVQDAPEDMRAAVQKNITRALSYEQAVGAWTEAARLLDPRLAVSPEKIKQRLPVLQKPLAVFGQAGKDMFAKLEQRAAEADAAPASGDGTAASTQAKATAQSTAASFGLTIEQLWSFEHFMRLRDYYDQTLSRTSARCVHLGGLELSQYPYYGYILDLLDEIMTFGQEIMTLPAYKAIIEAKYKGGYEKLQRNMAEYKKEFEDNAPPELLNDEAELADIKMHLGDLARDRSDGNIGPAPDGFESGSASPVMVKRPAPAPGPGPAPGPRPVVKRPAPPAPGPKPTPQA